MAEKGETTMSEKKRIAEWRQERHLTQMQLAVKAEVTIGTIQSIEAGRRGVNINTAQRLAEALGVTLNDIEWPSDDEVRMKRPKKEAAVA